MFATREGHVGDIAQPTRHLIREDDIFVALPSPKALRRLVEVEYGTGRILAPVMDVGPHSVDDAYWETGGRPKAEFGQRTTSFLRRFGAPKNRAGIDLSDQAFRELGMKDNARVWWRFYSLGGRKDRGACGG